MRFENIFTSSYFPFVFYRRFHEDLNNKCQDEKILNSKLYELERKNVVLATENKEVCLLIRLIL